jgi:hypothetical protein
MNRSSSSSSCFPLSVSLQRRPPPIVGVFPGRQLPLRRSSYAFWPPVRPLPRCLPEPPRAPSTASSCLPPARAPLFSLGMRPVNFYFLLSPRAHPHSCSFPRSTTSPEPLYPPPSPVSAAPPLQFRAPPAPLHFIAPFMIRSSSSFRACAAQNATPAISLSAAVLTLVEPKSHPFSSFAKSTISATSPRRSSLTNFLHLLALQSPERHRHTRNLAAPALSLVKPPPLSFPSTIPTTSKSAVSS